MEIGSRMGKETPKTRQIGNAAEERAARYLEAQGLKVIERNWQVRGGEIDLICQQGDTLVFVEVRARASTSYGGAGGSITASKQRRLILAARHYLATLRREPPCRFDAVLIDSENLQWVRDAFQAGS